MKPDLDVDSILAIHREPKGYIGFCRKNKNGNTCLFGNLFSLSAGELRSIFPAVIRWLLKDSYFTVNAYHRAAPYPNQMTGLPDVWRKEKFLSKLNACYSDIDCGRPGSSDSAQRLSWRVAQHQAEYLMDEKIIPHASIMARSGRGVYLLWCLHDDKDPEKLQHAWPEKIQLYKKINCELDKRLRTHRLPADLRAIDAARVLRVPGSIHSETERRVTYILELDQNRHCYVYTLKELAEFLDIPVVNVDLPDNVRAFVESAKYRRVKNPGSAPLRSRGGCKLNALRAQDLLTIAQGKGGILKRGWIYPDGCTSPGRRFTLTLFLNFLYNCGTSRLQAHEQVDNFAASMMPHYPCDSPDQDPPIESLVEAEYSAHKQRWWSNKKLCALLGITPELAYEWDLKTIVPAEITIKRNNVKHRKSEALKSRRELIDKLLIAGKKTQTIIKELAKQAFVVDKKLISQRRKKLRLAGLLVETEHPDLFKAKETILHKRKIQLFSDLLRKGHITDDTRIHIEQKIEQHKKGISYSWQ